MGAAKGFPAEAVSDSDQTNSFLFRRFPSIFVIKAWNSILVVFRSALFHPSTTVSYGK